MKRNVQPGDTGGECDNGKREVKVGRIKDGNRYRAVAGLGGRRSVLFAQGELGSVYLKEQAGKREQREARKMRPAIKDEQRYLPISAELPVQRATERPARGQE